MDVPASYLEMLAAKNRAKKHGYEAVIAALATNAAKLVDKSPEIAERALNYFGADIIREQENREAVVKQAVIATNNFPSPNPNESIPVIDDDWLHQFRKLAVMKSNAEIQEIWGRILAGEIYKPGSFSPMTLEIMARLDQRTAKMFEGIVNYTFIIEGRWNMLVTSGLGKDGEQVDFINQGNLMHLESIGLIRTNGLGLMGPENFTKLPPFTFGGKKALLSEYPMIPVPESKINSAMLKISISGTYLTQAAGQLQSIIPKTFNAAYAKKLRDSLRRSGVELALPEVDLDVIAA